MWRWGYLQSMALLIVALASCSENNYAVDNTGEDDPGDGQTEQSSVTFTEFAFQGFDADGTTETGLELHWGIMLDSPSGRDLRVVSYSLHNSFGALILGRDDPLPEFAHEGEILYDKERWVPIDGPTSAGSYTFRITYHTGQLLTDNQDNLRWQGPIEAGVLDTAFAVDP